MMIGIVRGSSLTLYYQLATLCILILFALYDIRYQSKECRAHMFSALVPSVLIGTEILHRASGFLPAF